MEVLDRVEVVAGYSTYLDLIRPLLTHQEIIVTVVCAVVVCAFESNTTRMNAHAALNAHLLHI